MYGWNGGGKSHFKDCVQEIKNCETGKDRYLARKKYDGHLFGDNLTLISTLAIKSIT